MIYSSFMDGDCMGWGDAPIDTSTPDIQVLMFVLLGFAAFAVDDVAVVICMIAIFISEHGVVRVVEVVSVKFGYCYYCES